MILLKKWFIEEFSLKSCLKSHELWGLNKLGRYCYHFYTLPHDSGGILWFTLVIRVSIFHYVCPSTHLSVFSFLDIDLSKYQRIFTKTWYMCMCIDIVEICLALLMGKLHQFCTVICPPQDSGRVCHSMFLFTRETKSGDFLFAFPAPSTIICAF